MGLKATTYLGDAGYENYSVLQKKSLNYFDAVANSNKFYTVELHEANGKYRVFTEYGRLGKTSTKQVRETTKKWEAERELDDIVRSKVKKGYVEIELAQSTTGSTKAKTIVDSSIAKVEKKASTQSSLDAIVQKFITQIFDEAGKALDYFVSGSSSTKGASPLGKLSQRQIDKGRQVLQSIAYNLDRGEHASVINQLSSEYYRHIPKAFGSTIDINRIAINSQNKISQEMDILKFYEDSLRMGVVIYDSSNIDKQYESLNCDIGVLDKRSKKHKEIVDYVIKTQSNHHYVTLDVVNIFTVNQKRAPKFNDACGNVRELFHGSRSANLPGILSSHLKLPSKLQGVHITGAMFGPGIYFADQSTKSSQYSVSRFGGSRNNYNTAFMFLADVALGKIKEETDSKYYYDAPRGYDSVKGVQGRSLLHNEYIIYKEDQQALRYIIEFASKTR